MSEDHLISEEARNYVSEVEARYEAMAKRVTAIEATERGEAVREAYHLRHDLEMFISAWKIFGRLQKRRAKRWRQERLDDLLNEGGKADA